MMFGDVFKKRKRLLFLSVLFFSIPFLLVAEKVKVYEVPSDIKIQYNGLKETVIHNLSDEEIYATYPIEIFNDYIYMTRFEEADIVKLTLKGKVVAQFGRKGNGPQEFTGGFGTICFYKDQLVVLDRTNSKLVFLDKNLKYIKETRYFHPALDFMINGDEYFFFGASFQQYYFKVYNMALKPLRSVGATITPVNAIRKSINFDTIRTALYVPQEKGLWCSFGNRYNLRYYKNEKLAIEIKERKEFFKGTEEEMMGKKFIMYEDWPSRLVIQKNSLIYFFVKDNTSWCDVFDLTNVQIKKRMRSSQKYNRVVHYKDNIFYAVRYDESKDNAYLVKLDVSY